MRLKREGERYVLESSYEERLEPKRARFRWDPAAKAWWTDDRKKAAIFAHVADTELRADLDGLAKERDAALEASRATNAALDVPSPEGVDYLPFQKAGIAYAMARTSTLIGDEMGLGKTIQAIGVANADESVKRVLVICPASLKLNWKRELGNWMVRDLSVGIADSLLWPKTDVVIINYDVLHKHAERLRSLVWDLMIVDECHYVKNPKARRSAQVYGSKKRGKVIVAPIEARRRLFLTGTPIVNRPKELYPILSAINAKEWGSFWAFGKRYCNPPEAPIWMADMTWKPLGNVKVGDRIVGWQMGEPGPRSKKGQAKTTLCKATVTAVSRRIAPLVKVILESGRIIRCTPDHRWLSGRSNQVFGSDYKYVAAEEGRKLVLAMDEVKPLRWDLATEAAYLGGIYDGEGTWPRIAQHKAVNPEVYARIGEALSYLGFQFTKDTEGYRVLGGRAAAIRFLVWCKPAKRKYIERSILSSRFGTPDEVVGIQPDGYGEVMSLTTTTGNYVAWGYCSKNCGAHHNGFGWDFDGASNLDELHERLRATCMVRRLKRDVLPELPAKRRQVIELSTNGSTRIVDREKRAWAAYQERVAVLEAKIASLDETTDKVAYESAVAELRAAYQVAFTEMSAIRHATAVAKIPYVIEHLHNAVDDDSEHKVVCFAWHKDVINAIVDHFNGTENRGQKIRKVDGARTGDPKSGGSQEGAVQVPVRHGKAGGALLDDGREIPGVPRMQAGEARAIADKDLQVGQRGEKQSETGWNRVYGGLAEHLGSGSLSASRDTTEVQQQPLFTEQSIAGQERPDAGVYAGEHLDHQLARQRDQAQRIPGGASGAYQKLEGRIAVRVYGETPLEERQAAVDLFQNDPRCQIFVGSITAAGVGLTLTAASHVVFAELDWVPGNVSQAEDRCHRIGQRESVLVQHLVFDGSMDATIAKTLVRKQRVIDKALDGQIQPRPEVAPTVAPKRPVNGEAEAVPEMTAEQVEAIQEGLRLLAGRCDGARTWDGAGFSKFDAGFGRDLAMAARLSTKQAQHGQRLVRKYRKQLPEDVLRRAGLA